MQGVTKYYPQGDAAVQSLVAGNDMLCLPGDVPQAIDTIQAAIAKGVLDSNDIASRVKKVLLAKYNLGLNKLNAVDTTNLYSDLNKNVKSLRAKVARNAITLLRLKDSSFFPLHFNNKKPAYVAVGVADSNALAAFLSVKKFADVYFIGYDKDSTIADSVFKQVSKNYEAVVIGVHHFNKYPANNFGLTPVAIDLIKNLQSSTHAITMVFGNPYALKNFCDAGNLVACYEDDAFFQQAAFDWLNGKIRLQGKLPVTVCGAFHYGNGITGYGLKKLHKAKRR